MSEAPRIDPVAVRSAQFQGSFRKYDSRAVDQYLAALADDLVRVNNYIDELERQVATAPRISARQGDAGPDSGVADFTVGAPDPAPRERPSLSTLSDEELAQLLGEETAHVLTTARKAAEEIRSKAEESAGRVIRDSTAEATQIRDEAEAEVARLTAEVEEVRDKVKREAEEEAKQTLEQANADAERRVDEARAMADEELVRAERVRSEADADAERILDDAKEQGRSMVSEAKEVRSRILEDLQKRRDQGRAQIERLVIGRDRLLQAYAAVQANVDDMTHELETVLDSPFERDPGIDEGFVGIVSTTAPSSSDTEAETGDADVSVDEDEDVAALTEAPAIGDDAGDEPVEETTDAVAPGGSVDEAAAVTVGDSEDGKSGAVAAAGDNGVAAAAETKEADADTGTGTGTDATAESTVVAEAGERDVDELFARIRAEREESVARAQAVLSGDDTETPSAGAGAAEQAPARAGEAGEDGDVERVPREHLAAGEIYDHRREVVDAQLRELSRVLKRLLADEQNEVLDALRRTESTALDDLFPGEEEHVAAYARTAEPVLAAVALAAAERSGAGEAGSADVTTLAQSLGASLIEPFRRRADRSAREVGGDHEELDERLRSLYREWKIEHIGAIATDALYSAYAIGQYSSAPDDAQFRWLIDPDQGPCPDAQDNALEGPVAKGEEFPTGDLCPQAHAGCHCLLMVES